MIIDAHCHAAVGVALTPEVDDAAMLRRYARRAAQAGITHTVLLAGFHSDYARANAAVARVVAAQPERYFGLAFVHARRDRGRIEAMVRAAVEQYGFVGIKAHRKDAPISAEICDAARYFGLPVLYDPVGDVTVAETLGSSYADVNFILPHLGSFDDDWRAQRALIGHLVRYQNIFTDSAGVRNFDVLAQAVREAGAHKVLFGSDGPWLHPGVELAKIRLLHLPPADEALVLGENLLRLVRVR